MTNTKIVTTIGLYKDGSFVINGVDPEDLQVNINYNKAFRFGRALFVDGTCVHNGLIPIKQIEDFTEKIKNNPDFVRNVCTSPYR